MHADRHVLFLVASTRLSGTLGNTEALARAAAAGLPAGTAVTWRHLNGLQLPPFEDRRHDRGTNPAPSGDLALLLDDLLAATDVVFVAPVYWYSLPAPLKAFIDHWSAFLRVPGLDFKARMAGKRLALVTTSGDRAKAQPMVDSVALIAGFMGMAWGGALWGLGGPPGTVAGDAAAQAAAPGFLTSAPAA
jgi:multimeric flavodoxin WrbA